MILGKSQRKKNINGKNKGDGRLYAEKSGRLFANKIPRLKFFEKWFTITKTVSYISQW